MGPATWFGIARIQKDQRFRDYADREFWAAKDFLFDSQEHLFYRDSRFIGKTGAHGEKILWGRGNGWVLAGLVNRDVIAPNINQPIGFFGCDFVDDFAIEKFDDLLESSAPNGSRMS
jgi:hypothetical protein